MTSNWQTDENIQTSVLPAFKKPVFLLLQNQCDRFREARYSTVSNGIHGHGGVQRTLEILKNTLNLTWRGMRNDISTFIERCPCCQKMKRLKPVIHTIPFTLASYQPIKRICVDAIGPINIDGQEYKHIVVFIDAFSRYEKRTLWNQLTLKKFYTR